MFRKRFQQIVHQHDVHHGTFIQNQNIPFQWMLFVLLIAFRRLIFQQTVNGLRLHSRGFRHAFRCSAGRRRQQDLAARKLISRYDPQRSCRFSGSGSAGQDHDFGRNGRPYRFQLYLIIDNVRTLHHLLYNDLRIHVDLSRSRHKPYQPLRTPALREIKWRQIDRFFVFYHVFRPEHLIQRDLQFRCLYF